MTKTVTVQAQQKWEYSCLTRKTEATLVNELNVLGQEGWDVVTVMFYKDMKANLVWTAFVKRPSTGEGPRQPIPTAGGALSAAARKEIPVSAGFDLSEDDFKMEE
jgi:hypothetical protein